jgi:hypothetical protein
VATLQSNTLNSLLSGERLFRMTVCSGRYGAANTYGIDELLGDAKKGIWSELGSASSIDYFRRNLQKTYVNALINLVDPPPPVVPAAGAGGRGGRGFAGLFTGNIKNTDVPSIARAQLVDLKNEIAAAIPRMIDKLSRAHLQDVQERIKQALNPKQ